MKFFIFVVCTSILGKNFSSNTIFHIDAKMNFGKRFEYFTLKTL